MLSSLTYRWPHLRVRGMEGRVRVRMVRMRVRVGPCGMGGTGGGYIGRRTIWNKIQSKIRETHRGLFTIRGRIRADIRR